MRGKESPLHFLEEDSLGRIPFQETLIYRPTKKDLDRSQIIVHASRGVPPFLQ
ncbi:MAG: hypothetical protein QMD88_07015 [Coprothermobacterota bacterium]|nr:hypothetical protein [Coprothermobacterota bacterium]